VFDYQAVTAWAALLAAFVALIAVWVEGRRNRFSQGLDLLLRLKAEFDSQAFRWKRQALAKSLVKQNRFPPEPSPELEAFIAHLMDHFQIVGLLLRKGRLDSELIYSEYFFWLHHYFFLFRTTIAAYRREDATIWYDAEWLYQRLLVHERRNRPKGDDVGPSKESLDQFLVGEAYPGPPSDTESQD